MIPDPGTILAAHAVDLRWSRWLAETEEDEHDQIGEEVDRCTCICGEEMDEEDFPAHQLAVLADAGWSLTRTPDVADVDLISEATLNPGLAEVYDALAAASAAEKETGR